MSPAGFTMCNRAGKAHMMQNINQGKKILTQMATKFMRRRLPCAKIALGFGTLPAAPYC